MKKIISLLCLICLSITLSACSSKNNDDILAFFQAFHNTLNTDSGDLTGTIEMANDGGSSITMHMQYNQVDQLQLSLQLDLEADGNSQPNFLCFYINDNKTYLNSMGTTSQSILSNLGIDGNQKISVYDPFMNFTDDELTSFMQSSSKKGNTYSYTLDAKMLSTLLDSLGTVSVQNATLEAVIEDDLLQSFTLHIEGSQSLENSSADVDFTIHCTIQDINSLEQVDFPSDLESY